jgi:hypothetical protein
MNKYIPTALISILAAYYYFQSIVPKKYTIDCTLIKNNTKISDTFLSAIDNPSQAEAEFIVRRYLEQALCFNNLKGDLSFAPKPYFFNLSDLSQQYQVVSYHSAGFRSPGNLQIKFSNNTYLNFCFSRMVINCNRATDCDCPYDFNWEPKPK